MRAMAKSFEISQAALSQVLSGKKNLSSETAGRVAEKLGLNARESDYFVLLVQLESTSDPRHKDLLLKKINSSFPRQKVTDFSVDLFRAISSPHHFTILMMTELEDFDFSPKFLAKRLGITALEAELSIVRLEQLELLEKTEDGRYRRVRGNLQVMSDAPNTAMKAYHKSILGAAIESIDRDLPKDRITSSEQVALRKSDLKELRRLVQEFYSKVSCLSSKPGKKDAVFNVGVLAFDLTKERK